MLSIAFDNYTVKIFLDRVTGDVLNAPYRKRCQIHFNQSFFDAAADKIL